MIIKLASIAALSYPMTAIAYRVPAYYEPPYAVTCLCIIIAIIMGGQTMEQQQLRFDAPQEDQARLKNQHDKVFALMKDGKKRTLAEIEYVLGYPQSSISARLRDLRKERFGGHIVMRQRVAKDSGTYLYWLSGHVS